MDTEIQKKWGGERKNAHRPKVFASDSSARVEHQLEGEVGGVRARTAGHFLADCRVQLGAASRIEHDEATDLGGAVTLRIEVCGFGAQTDAAGGPDVEQPLCQSAPGPQ